MDNVEKERVFDILETVGFYDNIPKISFNSARMKDVLYNLPKVIDNHQNSPLPTIKSVEDSSDLEGQGITKIVIPSNLIDIFTR